MNASVCIPIPSIRIPIILTEKQESESRWMQAPMCARWLCCQKSLRATTLIAFFPLSTPSACKTIFVSYCSTKLRATFAFFPLSTPQAVRRCAKQSLSLSGKQVAKSWGQTTFAFFPHVHQYLQNNIFICLFPGIKLDNSINSSWESSSTALMEATFAFFPLLIHNWPTCNTIPFSISFWESSRICELQAMVVCIESSLLFALFPKLTI